MIFKCRSELVKVNMIVWQERELGRAGLLLERKEVSIGHWKKQSLRMNSFKQLRLRGG